MAKKQSKKHTSAAAELGRRGGKKRAETLTAAERRAIARKAGIASGKARRRKDGGA